MSEPRADLAVVGAGVAGLATAILAARAGRRVVVYERHREVGARFHGDFQGLENWTSEVDAIAEIEALGIAPTFDAVPCRRQVVFGPDGREYEFRSAVPFFYLVRRGPDPGTLDHALKEQALAAGVTLRFGERITQPPPGSVVAWGPRRADILSVGYLFATDHPDGAYAVLDDGLAPLGYGYLLIHGGRATLASCMFRDFRQAALYLRRTVEIFRRRLGITLDQPRRFGGVGNVHLPGTFAGSHWTAGEAAGTQDALWGFGIRHALRSAHQAAAFEVTVAPRLRRAQWEATLGGPLRTSLWNRHAFNWLRRFGYLWLLRRLERAPDPRLTLRRLYAPALWKRLLLPPAPWMKMG